jgi:hypothetical protein
MPLPNFLPQPGKSRACDKSPCCFDRVRKQKLRDMTQSLCHITQFLLRVNGSALLMVIQVIDYRLFFAMDWSGGLVWFGLVKNA